MTTHTKCVEESIFQLSIDADKDWFVARYESHPSSHEPHQMMTSHSHPRLIWVKCKVLLSVAQNSRQQNNSTTI